MRWAQRSGHGDLVGTYIARRSAHNAGSAVDATLVRIGDGWRLRMGRYDALGPGAYTLSATGRVLHNRLTRAGHAALRLRRLLGEWCTSSTASGGRATSTWRSAAERAPPAIIEQMTEPFRVALAQIDPTVGDIRANARKIADYTARPATAARPWSSSRSLALTGYPPEDLLLKTTFLDAAGAALDELAVNTRGIVALVVPADDVYNAAALLADGEVAAVYRKIYLPNYGVFDEQRYQSGSEAAVFEFGGVPIGISICEDIWEPGPPAMAEALAGAQVIVNLGGTRIGSAMACGASECSSNAPPTTSPPWCS